MISKYWGAVKTQKHACTFFRLLQKSMPWVFRIRQACRTHIITSEPDQPFGNPHIYPMMSSDGGRVIDSATVVWSAGIQNQHSVGPKCMVKFRSSTVTLSTSRRKFRERLVSSLLISVLTVTNMLLCRSVSHNQLPIPLPLHQLGWLTNSNPSQKVCSDVLLDMTKAYFSHENMATFPCLVHG